MTRNITLARHDSESMQSGLTRAFDRRHLLGLAAGVGAAVALPQAVFGSASGPRPASISRVQGEMIAVPTGTYTWLLDSPSALQPAAPGAPSDAELDELLVFQSERTEEMARTVDMWAGRPAVFPWLEFGMRLGAENLPPGLFRVRAQALLSTAMSDAIVAALDAQRAIERPSPAAADDRIEPIGGNAGAMSSFPSLHAAVAGAASTVLGNLFPDASDDGFSGLANEAATSRLWAGANYRSDIESGLELGQAVGDLAVERGASDSSDAVWDGSGWPTGDGLYEATGPNFADPFQPLGGTWATWVLPSGDALRPAAFPAFGTAACDAELSAVQRSTSNRTPDQERIIDFWLGKGPDGFYTSYAQDLIGRHALNEAEAASVLAMLAVAMYDGAVSTWDAKFHFWIARPFTIDPSLNLYIPNPPYPSYPAGFPNALGAGATVLAELFPASAADLYTTAREGAVQRHWSGIHYVLDNDIGLLMGGQIGRMTVDAVRAAPDS